MSVKAFFYKQMPTKRYQFSEHPEVTLYLIGLTDAGEFYHAHMILLVTAKPDSSCLIQELQSSPLMNEKIDNIPYHELSGMFELIQKLQLVVEHFNKKGLKIPK